MTLTARILGSDDPTGDPSVPDSAEMVARAQALVPELVAAQHETELRGHCSSELHQRMSEAGFYRMLVPRRYGGYQHSVDTFFRVTMMLARGCPSTAWMFSRGAIHALTAAGLFSEQAQAELFATGEFVAPATMVPGGEAARSGDNGWSLNGVWASCAGTPFATHFIGHLMVDSPMGGAQLPLMFIAPRSEWRAVEDANTQLGLRGSGSHGIAIVNGRIPNYFALLGTQLADAGEQDSRPGASLHDNPEYGGSAFSYLVLERASLAVGVARGALDAYEELMRTRKTLVPPIVDRRQDPDYQYWYGEAIGLIATAEAAVFDAIRQWHGSCVAGQASREVELQLAAVCRHVIKLCWQAVEHYVFPTAGASAARHGGRLERLWRDMSMVQSQTGYSMSSNASRDLAKVHLGVL